MKTLVAGVMLGGVLTMQPVSVAWADAFDGLMFSLQAQGQGGAHRDRGGGGQGRQQAREARTAQPAPPPAREPARGQLTPEERRQLHRDLDKANREIYGGRR